MSDDAILAEVAEAADPNKEAEQTLKVLRNVAVIFDDVNNRLTSRGHKINTKRWRRDPRGYQNSCVECGLSANFTLAGQVWGEALEMPCPANGLYVLYGQTASR